MAETEIQINQLPVTATVADPGVDTQVPTEKAVRDAVAAALTIRYVTFALNGSVSLVLTNLGYWRARAAFVGMKLVSIDASVGDGAAGASSSGDPTFMVYKNGTAMLSTACTVDVNEYSSVTDAHQAVIKSDGTEVLALDDLIKVAPTTAGTGVTYATVTLGFQ